YLRRWRRQRRPQGADRLPSPAEGQGDAHRGAAAWALRRAGAGRHACHQLPGKAEGRRRLDQRRLLRLRAVGAGAHQGRRNGLGARAARTPGARAQPGGLFPQGLLAADGYAARQDPPGGTLGRRQAAVEELVIRREFWAGKRVLVTGHTGFKGSWLALWLASMGARVSGYALAPATDPALWPLLGLAGEMQDIAADVRDP